MISPLYLLSIATCILCKHLPHGGTADIAAGSSRDCAPTELRSVSCDQYWKASYTTVMVTSADSCNPSEWSYSEHVTICMLVKEQRWCTGRQALVLMLLPGASLRDLQTRYQHRLFKGTIFSILSVKSASMQLELEFLHICLPSYF